MLLAGDVGGTKTLLGLFEPDTPRPRPVARHEYSTNSFRSFVDILETFELDLHHELTVDAAAIGVAGPVLAQRAKLPHIVWGISAEEIAARCRIPRVRLLNDLEAMAASVSVLRDDEVEVLQQGEAHADGHAAVIAAGTGLGEAYLHYLDGKLVPLPSEGGHADFAPQNAREVELVQWLHAAYGRAQVEHVVSGQGLLHLHQLTHRSRACTGIAGAVADPAAVSQSALEGRCAACTEALELFVDAYASEAGNLALRGVATGGVFVGGGIAPKILPVLRGGRFIDAFRNKPPMTDLLSRMPVVVILNPDAGLIGASIAAASL